jgi:N-methylhydantoinase B
MKIDLRRTSYNPIINEMNDFAVGIFNERAETLAQAPGLPEFVCDIPSAIFSIVDDIGGFDKFRDGDVYLTNDPYANTFHVHDVNAIKPIFYEGVLVGFSCARAHWHDIGGSSAAGNLTATEVFQEGLILRSIRLYAAGELNHDVMRIIRENTRLPETVVGDLRAQVGCCNIGARRLLEVIRRFGIDTYRACADQILSDGELLALDRLNAVPNGTFTAESCVDNDGLDLDTPLVIRASVTKSQDRLVIDLTGSAESCRGPMNANRNTTRSMCRLIFKMMTTPTEPANEGHFRMVDVVIPEKSIFNAQRPKATMPGFFALETLEDVVKRALAESMPDRVNADDYGRCTPAHIKFFASDGTYRILADTEGGGWGGNNYDDGEHAMLFGEVRVIPIEIMEMRYPVRLRQYSLRQNSGGPGRFRGGLGIIKEYECLIDAKLNAGLDRQVCPPQGILGGGEALSNRTVIIKKNGEGLHLPSKVTDYTVKAGEIISLQTGGGGGYGNPLERELHLVDRDLMQGLISREQAENDYGVVVTSDDSGRARVNRQPSEARRMTAFATAQRITKMGTGND